jgi:hypothetical protein
MATVPDPKPATDKPKAVVPVTLEQLSLKQREQLYGTLISETLLEHWPVTRLG